MKLESLTLTLDLLKLVARETRRGKSLPRTFLNYQLRGVTLTGEVLDLGSKSDAASYNRFLQRQPPGRVTYTDLQVSDDRVIKLDLEAPFPLADAVYDMITCFNTLEHVYHYQNAVAESYRILKPGGVFIGGTPFLVNYHADPHDYWRYTDEGLVRIFQDAGFEPERMVYLGLGPLTAGLSLYLNVFPKFFRPLVALKVMLIDWLILNWKESQRGRYPLGYAYIFRKSPQQRIN